MSEYYFRGSSNSLNNSMKNYGSDKPSVDLYKETE